MVLYSLAEVQAGHARCIRVNVAGRNFRVSDDGRGHAIERTIAEMPYLDFIYTQFDFPFGSDRGGAIQLQGIGMSLLNSLCGELEVSVRKPLRSLRLRFAGGRLIGSEVREHEQPAPTGNAVAGSIHSGLHAPDLAAPALRAWLQDLLRVSPGLRLWFNDEALLPGCTPAAA